ncbi:phosphatase PAP2 family protein [Haloplanus aerogenes]|uniref:PAP2 superfamily protein n=1 Tax=Haloplanus aerogenes TaxID=660522 RepID=A0A3M0DQI2_9EURY|nr:phosphatase PAP2 family protein [Haloplanus aerogenes]AZH24364.1 phosphatase PAP2 family protein [Haloplanus aerogenes]RMB23998.1 PAP2 superfamily protein [Haloplanus aerogenes]
MTHDPHRRLQEAFLRRERAARQQLLESTYRTDESDGADDPVACYGKALRHRDDGVPTASAYDSLVGALETGTVEAYNAIELDESPEMRPLAEPHGAHGFEGMGADPWAIHMAAPPAFSSSEMGAELIELYCRSLCRDVPFGAYGDDGAIADAIDDLNGATDYAGPAGTTDPHGGMLDANTVFRGLLPGTQTGPHVSQLLWKDVPRGAVPQSQRIRVLAGEAADGTGDADVVGTGPDYLTDWDTWLRVQRGVPVGRTNPPPTLVDAGGDPDAAATRHIVTGRDLANKVRRQVPYLAIRDAAEILLGMGVPFDRRIPYRQGSRESATDGTSGIRTATPVINFGSHDVLESVVSVFDLAQTAAWYRKWLVHRRLRPEEYAGRLESERRGAGGPFDLPDTLRESTAPSRVVDAYGTSLLPQAYTEGCPTHPSYPAGHSVVAGATVTLLKAMFDGRHPFPVAEMVVPVADGTVEGTMAGGGTTTVQSTRLAPVTEVSTALGATADSLAEVRTATITVNDELNKLATNVALGRNWAGIHYRSDGIEGLLLGEQVAVRYLQDHLRSTDLPFDGYRLEPFFDAYPGTQDGAAPNLDRDAILITPDRITTPDDESSSISVDDPAR